MLVGKRTIPEIPEWFTKLKIHGNIKGISKTSKLHLGNSLSLKI